MKDLVSTLPYGPKLRQHLLQKLEAAIERHRETLHPEDAQMASLELRSWMKACDRIDQEDLNFYVSRAWTVVRAARGDDARSTRLYAMRAPHATYALAALKSRFGIDRAAEVTA